MDLDQEPGASWHPDSRYEARPALLTENTAPRGSASTAVLPTEVSKGETTTSPPSRAALSAADSTSSTQKSTLQCADMSSGERSSLIGTITPTTSRETGCSGSPPT